MSDSLSREKRSWNMSRIKGKDTSIEIMVRKYLFHRGFRYRKNVCGMPGKPDIVLPKYHTVIFVHGCFWHRHPGCRFAYSPKTRIDYWQAKFDANVRNDQKNIQLLKADGWNVLVLWECDIRKNFETTMENAVLKIEADMAYEHFIKEADG